MKLLWHCLKRRVVHDFPRWRWRWRVVPSFPQAAERRQQFQHGWYFDPVFFGDYPAVMREQVRVRVRVWRRVWDADEWQRLEAVGTPGYSRVVLTKVLLLLIFLVVSCTAPYKVFLSKLHDNHKTFLIVTCQGAYLFV